MTLPVNDDVFEHSSWGQHGTWGSWRWASGSWEVPEAEGKGTGLQRPVDDLSETSSEEWRARRIFRDELVQELNAVSQELIAVVEELELERAWRLQNCSCDPGQERFYLFRQQRRGLGYGQSIRAEGLWQAVASNLQQEGLEMAQGKGKGQVVARGKGKWPEMAQGKCKRQVVAQGKGKWPEVAQGKGKGQVVAQGKGKWQEVAQGKGKVQEGQRKGKGQEVALAKGKVFNK